MLPGPFCQAEGPCGYRARHYAAYKWMHFQDNVIKSTATERLSVPLMNTVPWCSVSSSVYLTAFYPAGLHKTLCCKTVNSIQQPWPLRMSFSIVRLISGFDVNGKGLPYTLLMAWVVAREDPLSCVCRVFYFCVAWVNICEQITVYFYHTISTDNERTVCHILPRFYCALLTVTQNYLSTTVTCIYLYLPSFKRHWEV